MECVGVGGKGTQKEGREVTFRKRRSGDGEEQKSEENSSI